MRLPGHTVEVVSKSLLKVFATKLENTVLLRVGDLSYLLFVLSVLVSRVEGRTSSLWNGADLIGFFPSCCERS